MPKYTSCHKGVIVMTERTCCFNIIHICYAHPDLLGVEHSVCFLSLDSCSIFVILVALLVTSALFGFLNASNMQLCVDVRKCSSCHKTVMVMVSGSVCDTLSKKVKLTWKLACRKSDVKPKGFILTKSSKNSVGFDIFYCIQNKIFWFVQCALCKMELCPSKQHINFKT